MSASKIIKYEDKKSGSEPDSFWTANEAVVKHDGHMSLVNLKSKDGAGLGMEVDTKSVVPSELQGTNVGGLRRGKTGVTSVSCICRGPSEFHGSGIALLQIEFCKENQGPGILGKARFVGH